MKGYTIVGTHTDCGKTFAACFLLQHYAQQGLSTLGFKPIASGAIWTQEGWKTQDTLCLQQASSIACSEKEITPFPYRAAISPHFAAKTQGLASCTDEQILYAHEQLLLKKPDVLIVETAGGVLSPLSDTMTSLSLCQLLHYPVILVVEIALGCLNTAQLSFQCLHHHKVPYAGWIANFKNPQLEARYAIANDLTQRLQARPLFSLSHVLARTA